MFWNWIRRKVAEAFLAGVQDAVESLESGSPDAPPLVLPESLTRRLALPAVPEAESENGHKKKVRT